MDEATRPRGLILVVDDDPTMRFVFHRTLAAAGFEVVEAGDGLEALELFRRHRRLAAVVLDLMMPRLDGYQTFRELRRLDPRLPVLVVSGLALEEALAPFPDRKYLSFLKKPIKPRLLVHQVGELIEAASAA